MSGSGTSRNAGTQNAHLCLECSAMLAHDQRYCLDCGARRGPLPSQLAATIAAIFERGRAAPAPRGPAVRPEPAAAPAWTQLPGWMPTPRAAAAAVLGMLSFGVLVGSTVGPGLAQTLSAPLRIIVSVGSGSSARSGSGAARGGGGSAPSTRGGGGGAGAAGGSTASGASAPAAAPPPVVPSSSISPVGNAGLPPIKHVFLIVLADQRYSHTFGSTDKYFGQTLPKLGELVPSYYAVTAGELANGIALISGQGPTPQTAADCPSFQNVVPGGQGKLGQVLGAGCVYPAHTQTLANELGRPKHGGWKAYVEATGTSAHARLSTCRHPAPGTADGEMSPRQKEAYVTWRNPFVYFHSLIDQPACQKSDVSLSRLSHDLKAAGTTPALSYVVPSPCDDGSDQPCRPGARSGLAPAGRFLQKVLPEIQSSPAYKADGLIAVTFDQAPQSGPQADTSACCDPQIFPNLPASASAPPAGTPGTTTTPASTTPTTPTTTSPASTTPTQTTTTAPTSTTPSTTFPGASPATPTGGGQVGIVLISKYVKPASVDFVDQYNHFSLLATIEKLLGVRRLGYAGDPALPVFGVPNFNNYFG